MNRPIPTRRQVPSEDGYVLVAVIFMLVILILTLSAAAPIVARDIQRDRERETVERGKQYVRAIQLYYRKFHAYPPNVDALVKTQEIRYLRKKYIDPVTGKDDWKPIRFGQAKTQTMGFFGQPLAGAGAAGSSVLAGTGPSGGNTSSFGGSNSPTGISSLFGATDSSTASPGSSTSPTGSSTDSSGTASSGSSGSGSSSISGSGSSLSGQTFGGAGIIGFSPASPRSSILIYKKKSHYNEWEFVYDPLSEMKTVSGNTGNVGTPASSAFGNSSSSSGFGNSSSGSSSFGSSSFGSGSSSSPTTTTP